MLTNEHIIFQDNYLVAINKPNGLLVHRTEISDETNQFAIQLLRDLIGKKVYNVHRIDRPTSGVLLFALSSEIASQLNRQFKEKTVKKTYIAVVRGWFPPVAFLNHPVRNGNGDVLDAETNFRLIEKFELPIPVPPYENSRYSIVEAYPATGRWHQIRQHFAHLRHYIINDRVHGTGPHNRMFTEELDISDLFLHARELTFTHPLSGERKTIEANLPGHWEKLQQIREKFSTI